ncbi:ABC transporter permease subunit [Pelagicoccus sp. SDUM812002]|nr:ABC transporter permease subunit [Pelagicoccus sp. SDUM812002]MDQ8185221.1 ABC transporter permease subunit [Pelagicoccus sp. SDUM812002]
MRLFLLLAVSGVVSLAGGLYFQEFNLGSSELRFIADFGFGAMTLLGSIVTVVATVQLLFGEIEHRTILPILSKPVRRGEFLVGKLLGAWLTICSFVAILTVALLLALFIREQQLPELTDETLGADHSVSYLGVLVFAGVQCFRLMVLASITAFFSGYASSSMFAVFMGFFVWVIGQLRGSLVAQWGEGFGQSVLKLLTLLIPDLRVFDLGTQVIEGAGVAPISIAGLVCYALVYTVLYGSLAALVLKHREF